MAEPASSLHLTNHQGKARHSPVGLVDGSAPPHSLDQGEAPGTVEGPRDPRRPCTSDGVGGPAGGEARVTPTVMGASAGAKGGADSGAVHQAAGVVFRADSDSQGPAVGAKRSGSDADEGPLASGLVISAISGRSTEMWSPTMPDRALVQATAESISIAVGSDAAATHVLSIGPGVIATGKAPTVGGPRPESAVPPTSREAWCRAGLLAPGRGWSVPTHRWTMARSTCRVGFRRW